MKQMQIRFYEELNDFLPPEKKKKRFVHEFRGNPSVKDLVESLGVPHTEIDFILVNGKSVGFGYKLSDNDVISVYPVFESFDISDVQRLRPEPLREPKFILDVHLGKLARYMRMFGLDTLYKNDYTDEVIVKISLEERRTILTRDFGILKRSEVTHGYYVRNTDPLEQAKEIIERFQLRKKLKPFSRCIVCNSLFEKTTKKSVINLIPEQVKMNCDDFFVCSGCKKIYWKGTHFDKMSKTIKFILE